MTSSDYRAALDALGLNQSAAARLLGVNVSTSQRWIAGDRSVPEPAARFLRFLVAANISPERVHRLLD